MTTPTGTGRRLTLRLIAAAGAAALAALAGVYVIVGSNGNMNAAQSCAVELAGAEAAKPYATGEVAAFIPATKPLTLTELRFDGPDGKPAALTDFKGRTILLNLWATWCAPCRKEMPALDKLQAEMGGENFEVVAVNLDRGGAEKPKAFLNDIGISRLDYYSDEKNGILKDLRTKARATGLPTTILVGPNGCEVGTMYGPAEWASDEAKAMITAVIEAQGSATAAN